MGPEPTTIRLTAKDFSSEPLGDQSAAAHPAGRRIVSPDPGSGRALRLLPGRQRAGRLGLAGFFPERGVADPFARGAALGEAELPPARGEDVPHRVGHTVEAAEDP